MVGNGKREMDFLTYERFISSPDKYLEKDKLINFEMIYNYCGGVSRTHSDKYC